MSAVHVLGLVAAVLAAFLGVIYLISEIGDHLARRDWGDE